jgi:hypothetical protein
VAYLNSELFGEFITKKVKKVSCRQKLGGRRTGGCLKIIKTNTRIIDIF